MKPYLAIWRNATGAPVAHRVIVAETLLAAAGIAEKDPQGHHASITLLSDTSEARYAISRAAGTRKLHPIAQLGAEAKVSWVFQEDMAATYEGKPVRAARWAFTERHIWHDAQALVEKVWPRGAIHELGPRLVYSLDAGLHHMLHWDVPLENYDLTFPPRAPRVTVEAEA
jgi:hypothetical protein